ncbi:hypothetical protein ANCCAN_09293 [Ancylostoma caninum]|uniref:Uncharacterized protein n=1 Tax=Ancylostoma caninum TaxID=29170 RepID=A0A368GM42_ANCCA|nr:hypothetical protein ANCCAN_09293 [Ancylostoma caninum]
MRSNCLFLCNNFRPLVKEDKWGYCSVGVNVDTSLAAIESAKKVIAIINPKVPRTHGNTLIHQSRIDSFVEVDREIYGNPEGMHITEEEIKIGKLIAENLVDDGATLQLGIGAIPDSTLLAMKNHKDLGIHTELLGDGVIDLIELGVINNSKKTVMPGKGAGVVTTRGHVRYVVTEYGIANLGGKNVRQRAYALIQIAHPDDRERLEKEAFQRLRCMPSP